MTLELPDLGRPGESLGAVLLGFARALGEDIGNLPDNPVVRIHDIRVGTKKLNALLRLAAPPLAAEERRQISALLREIRNTFAGSRDKEVLRARLDQVRADASGETAMQLGLEAGGPDSLPATDRAAGLARAVTDRIIALDLSPLTTPQLLANAASSYRKARRLLRRCRKSADDENMHQWRKRTKDVCYHAMALASLKPRAAAIAKLDALAERLGEYHDLALLLQRAIDHPELAAAIAERKHATGRECFRSAEKIFRKSPKEFAVQLTRHARRVRK